MQQVLVKKWIALKNFSTWKKNPKFDLFHTQLKALSQNF